MAKNYRGTGDRVHVTAAAARTSGTIVREAQFTGVPITNAPLNGRYALAIAGEWELTLVGGAAKGDDLFITIADGTLARAAHNAAPPAGTEFIGRITGIPTDSAAKGATEAAPPAGKMWARLDPGRN
jgi:hypothetical protein